MVWVWIVLGGTFSGVLINYLADVLPESRKLSKPRCPSCERPFNLREYLLLTKCIGCGKRPRTRPIMVHASAIIFTIFLKYFPFSSLSFLATLPLLIFVGVIVVIDFEHRLVLFETSIFGFVLCLVYGIFLHGLKITLLGGLGGLLIMLSFYFMGKGFTRVIGWIKHQKLETVAFGFGDVTLGTILGLLTGWPMVVGAIVITMLVFVAFSFGLFIYLIATKKYEAFASTLPFTTFLVIGAVAILYF